MSKEEDDIEWEDIQFEIDEAKKEYEKLPYYKKEQFESIRRSVFGDST